MRFQQLTLLLCFTLTLAGCYSPSGYLPEDKLTPAPRMFSQDDVNLVVERRFIKLPAALELNMPEECQSLRYNHFLPKNQLDSNSFDDADAVIMLMPGMQAGANVITYYAEQLVYTALTTRNAKVHVVTMERRNQCLIDNTGLEAAAKAKNIDKAREYYYEKAFVDGQQFQGFYQDRDLPFLTEFGLGRILTDIKLVAEHIYPDPKERQQKLFIGGHSLGGNLTSAFMGWDFDGDPSTLEDAGFNQAAGFLRIDISITPEDPAIDPFLVYGSNGFDIDKSNEANKNYRFAVHQMELGLASRVSRLPGATPETFMLVELVGMNAHWAPEEEATEIQQMPLGGGPSFLLRLIHSKDTLNFITNSPSIFDFRYTNEALLGVILDDDFMPITILQGSFGFLSAGNVDSKTFPGNETLKNLAASIDPFLGFLITGASQSIATDSGPTKDQFGGGPIYQWANYDEIGNKSNQSYTDVSGQFEFTTYTDEMTDISQLARIIYEGQTSFTEWYMPQRMSMDLQHLRSPEVIEGLNFYHYEKARGSRLLEIAGTESIVDTSVTPLSTLYIAQGYNHIDVLTAANDTPSHRENKVINPTLDFVLP